MAVSGYAQGPTGAVHAYRVELEGHEHLAITICGGREVPTWWGQIDTDRVSLHVLCGNCARILESAGHG